MRLFQGASAGKAQETCEGEETEMVVKLKEYVNECHNCTVRTCEKYLKCEDRKEREKP